MIEKTYPELVGDLVVRWVAGPVGSPQDVRQWGEDLDRDTADLAARCGDNKEASTVLTLIHRDLYLRGFLRGLLRGFGDPPPDPGVAPKTFGDPPPDPG